MYFLQVDFVTGQLRALVVTTDEPYKVDDIVIPPITDLLEDGRKCTLLSEINFNRESQNVIEIH